MFHPCAEAGDEAALGTISGCTQDWKSRRNGAGRIINAKPWPAPELIETDANDYLLNNAPSATAGAL